MIPLPFTFIMIIMIKIIELILRYEVAAQDR